jgi:hypothetical protein
MNFNKNKGIWSNQRRKNEYLPFLETLRNPTKEENPKKWKEKKIKPKMENKKLPEREREREREEKGIKMRLCECSAIYI